MIEDNLTKTEQAKALQAKQEQHSATNYGWLRAAVLGANDGIISF